MKCLITSLSVFLFIITGSHSRAGDAFDGRILMLGFTSKHINSLQDRLLRETVIRLLADRGYKTVGIMDLEHFFRNYHTHIRNIDNAGMGVLCDKLNAAIAVRGSIYKKGRSLVARVIIYDKNRKKFFMNTIPLASTNFIKFCPPLSREITSLVKKTVIQK